MGCKAIEDAYAAARENVPGGQDKSEAMHGVRIELERNPNLPRYRI